MLRIPHRYCRGYSRIHLRNESLSAMPLFGDFKVFPVLATRSDEQCLLKQNSNNFLIFVRFCPVNATRSTFLLGKDFHMPKVTAPPLWGEFLPYIHGQKKTGEIFAWWTLGLWITGSRSPPQCSAAQNKNKNRKRDDLCDHHRSEAEAFWKDLHAGGLCGKSPQVSFLSQKRQRRSWEESVYLVIQPYKPSYSGS